MATNLLTNDNFDDGHYHWHDLAEIVIPNGWDFWYLEDFKTRLERQDNDFLKPETVVWDIKDAPENEKSLFFLSGNFCLKIFKGWGPLWWRLFQKVSGLNPGGTYRFTAPVYPDLVAKYESGKKVYAPDMLSGEHKLIVKTGGKTFDTGWMDGNKVKFGQYNFLTLDFVADSTEAEVTLEVRGRWGLDNNGWFVDSPMLEAIDAAATQPAPPPATSLGGAPTGGNLFTNGDFDQGYYHWHDVPEIVIPNTWDFWYLEDFKTRLERQDNDFLKPETVVWNIKDAPENEKSLFFLSGNFCLKIFKGWGPLWWKLWQNVTGLTIGAKYRFTVPVYPDLVAKYESGKKVYAPDMLSGEHKLAVQSGSQNYDTGFMDGSKVKFGQYNTLTLDFVATDTTASCTLEVRGRWGLDNNGWFVDSMKLEKLT